MKKFKGLGVALITPFINDKVNYKSLKELLNFHLENKTDFLVILGTTAETPTLSYKERKKIIKFTVKHMKGIIPIMVGVGSNNTKETIKMANIAQRLGADGLLVVTPYYNRPPQRGLIEHFTQVAYHTNLPVILYNVPSRTGVDLSVSSIEKLTKINNIIGIKEASSDLNKIKEIKDVVSPEFIILTGNDEYLAGALKLGASGTISVTANIIPNIMVKQINDFNKGIDITNDFNHYLKLHQSMFLESNPVMVKQALNLMGFNVGSPRLPLVKTTNDLALKLKDILNEYGLIKND
ncbi:MAG: 4-hydroxy-tetrahydrodipicolinate synthase [Acholeplasmataceae bacterium]